jgi:hypothetical protein
MFHFALAFLLFLLLALICANCADKASTKHTKSHNVLIYNDTKQTVNLLAYAFDGSNPSPTTTFYIFHFVNAKSSHEVVTHSKMSGHVQKRDWKRSRTKGHKLTAANKVVAQVLR